MLISIEVHEPPSLPETVHQSDSGVAGFERIGTGSRQF
jgi:hypothetical protein